MLRTLLEAMPITFGSVGDIISVCLLVKDLATALNDSRGSSAEYQEVARELWSLERALLEVLQLSQTLDKTVEVVALWETARRTAENCRALAQVFSDRINKYDSSLGKGNGNSENPFIRDARKVERRVLQKDEVSRFRAEIAAHTHSINMLLDTANL